MVSVSKMDVRACPQAHHLPKACQLSNRQTLPMPAWSLGAEEALLPHRGLPILLSSFGCSFVHLLWSLLGVLGPRHLHSHVSSPSDDSNSISLKSSLNSLKTNQQSFPPSPYFISSIGPITHDLLSAFLCWDVSPITAGTFSSLLYSWHLKQCLVHRKYLLGD